MDNDGTNNNVKLLGVQRTPEINTTPSLASFDELPPTPPPIANSNDGSKCSLPHPNSSPDNSGSEEDVEAPRSPSQRSNKSKQERSKKKCGAARVISKLYARLLIVAAAILVLTEVLNNPVPLLYYNGYLFSYLIGGAIVCILTTYICVLAKKCPTLNDDLEDTDGEKQTDILLKDISVYLRIGILVLGLGTLTWIGMEIGTYFTVERFCMDELNLAQPILLGLFTLLQILFLFMNTPRVLKSLGWFRNIALMHLQAANLAVWIRLFLWETAKQWLEETHITHNSTIPRPQDEFNATLHVVDTDKNHKVYFGTRCLWNIQDEEKIEEVLQIKHCLQGSSIGAVWEKAMPFVFPFVLQFSLICSAVMYHLWQSSTLTVFHCNVNSTPRSRSPISDVASKQKCGGPKVDCRGSSKGLFLGLLVTVVGLIVLILFFVLTNNEKLHLDTVFIISSVHCGVMGLSVLAILIGLCKIKGMCSACQPQADLHSAIESWGTVSVFVFGACGMIVGSTQLQNTKYLVVFADGVAMLFHCCIQALFIQMLMKKCCRQGCEHEKSKPGRQTVTFLIFTNFVLWLMESITAQNQVAGKLQLNFYGVIPWSLIARGVLSVVMCYRFLCSAAMMDAWRNCYSSSR